jgi:hypothetical protein
MWPQRWGGFWAEPGGALTDRIAFVLAGVIALAVLADLVLNSGSALVFLSRKLIDLIELVAIWR